MEKENWASTSTKPSHPLRSQEKVEKVLAVFALATLILAWFIGTKRAEADIAPFLSLALPGAKYFESLPGGIYAGWETDTPGERVLGYVAVGEATGYGGPMKVAVGLDQEGKILGVSIVEHKETPSYLERVLREKFPFSLLGKKYDQPFIIGKDVDTITGATLSVRALAEAARKASRKVASDKLGFSLPPEESKPIRFGIPEVALILLFAVGFIARRQRFKPKKLVRWLSMLTGLVVIGFIYNIPLTLANINSLLLGYWPDWRSHLYWYFLVGGILFVFTVENKNPYCEWFCPFGAAQECLAAIGGAKTRTPAQYRNFFLWIQRVLAWTAIIIALLFRNPGLTSYEVFGTFFSLTGSEIQFALLVIILLVSLYARRPWCAFLCPLRPVTDFIRLVRNWIRKLWLKNLRKTSA